MPSWTELSNLPLGTTIETSLWNTIFGPDGNEAYLKQYADFVSYELEKVYYADNVVVRCGWPQGFATDSRGYEVFYLTGDVIIPKWYVAGYPTDRFITLDGPAKYLAVLNIQFYANSYESSVFRVIILDSTGGLNIQKTIPPPTGAISTGSTYTEYSFPIVIDAPFQTDLIVGFVSQQRLDTHVSLVQPDVYQIQGNTKISFYKLPVYLESPTVATSFVLGTSSLLGTSSF